MTAPRPSADGALRARAATADRLEAENEQLRAALADCIEAIRLTREYVGEDVLPALPGWEWWKATVRGSLLLHAPWAQDGLDHTDLETPVVP